MFRRTRMWLGAFIAVSAALYLLLLLVRSGGEDPFEQGGVDTAMHGTIALFGATGTIGDGLLKAAMNDPDVDRIHVITRRSSDRIDQGVTSRKVTMTTHKDYQDYSAITHILEEVDAVYWAIGLSAVGMEEKKYREIHEAYPLQLLGEWLAAGDKRNLSMHYVSGSGAKPDSRMMWAREKARAEASLAQLAQDSNIRVISYRPSVILPTESEAHMGHRILYTILAPIKSAVAAESIGEAMLEVSAQGAQAPNGMILENADILALGKSYQDRQISP